MKLLHFVFTVSLVAVNGAICAQERDPAGSFGLSSTYSPTSGHIFIGDSDARRTWTAGFEFSHRLYETRHLRLDYTGAVMPFFQESDPTVTGTVTVLAGATITSLQAPVRVVKVDHSPIGTAVAGPGLVSPIYAIYGRQKTYAASLLPLGVRISTLRGHRLQPTFTVDAGVLLSSTALPVDNAARFNYVFGFGPGVQVFSTPTSSVRLEYVYRHISNAGAGDVNPGIDQGVIRLTLSKHR